MHCPSGQICSLILPRRRDRHSKQRCTCSRAPIFYHYMGGLSNRIFMCLPLFRVCLPYAGRSTDTVKTCPSSKWIGPSRLKFKSAWLFPCPHHRFLEMGFGFGLRERIGQHRSAAALKLTAEKFSWVLWGLGFQSGPRIAQEPKNASWQTPAFPFSPEYHFQACKATIFVI